MNRDGTEEYESGEREFTYLEKVATQDFTGEQIPKTCRFYGLSVD